MKIDPIRFFNDAINQLGNLVGLKPKPESGSAAAEGVLTGALQELEQRRRPEGDHDQSISQVISDRSASQSSEPWYLQTIPGLKNNPNVTPEFLTEVNAMAERLGTQPEYILASMSFETGGTFSPAEKNRGGSSGTGLIQFMDDTAQELGTTTKKLSQMSSLEQLPYVEKYLKKRSHGHPLDSLSVVYETVLRGSPSGNSDPNHTLFSKDNPNPKEARKYTANAGLDYDKDGRITYGEFTSIVHFQFFGGVNRVEKQLKQLGFLTEKPDGRLGTDTSGAIGKFQTSKGLAATGYLDEATGHALFGTQPGTLVTPTAQATTPSTDKTSNKPTQQTPSSGPSLNYTPAGIGRGTQGAEVLALQDKLVDFGFMTREQQATGPGIFGPKTEAALKNFQTSQKLPAHGILDKSTKAALNAPQSLHKTPSQPAGSPATKPTVQSKPAANLSQRAGDALSKTPARTSSSSPALDYTPAGMGIGAEGPEVKALQNRLAELGHLPPSNPDGKFGPKTEFALKCFQRSQNLPTHGILDDATKAAMNAPQSLANFSPNSILVNKAIPELAQAKGQHISVSSTVFGDITITEGFMNLGAPHSVKKNPRYAIFSDDPHKVVKQDGGVQANIGIDYTTGDGRIRPWFSGTIEKVEYQPGGYGNIITIKTDQTFTYEGKEYPLYTHYAHADNFTIKEGRVEAGQDIGKQGNTGGSHGAHVDFRTWINVDGQKIDISPNFFVDVL